MIQKTASTSQAQIAETPVPIFRDKESLVRYLNPETEREKLDVDREFQRIRTLMGTGDGKRELLERIRTANPDLNGNIDAALKQITLNREQLEKKEGFLKKTLKLPGRALKAVGRTIKKHPFITAAVAAAAIVALLYFMPNLAPGVGAYGKKLIEAMKGVLQKVGVPVPEAPVDAIGNVPVTGGAPVPMEVAEQAAEVIQSPGNMDELTRVLQEVAK